MRHRGVKVEPSTTGSGGILRRRENNLQEITDMKSSETFRKTDSYDVRGGAFVNDSNQG